MIKEVTHYIRHRPPMLLVDEVKGSDAKFVQTQTEIGQDNLFFDREFNWVPSWVGLEIMAQTAGVWVGMEDERQGDEPQLGFLLGVRSYETMKSGFLLGETVCTSVNVIFAKESMVVFEGEIKDATGKLLAVGELTAFRPDDVDAYLRGDIK